MHYWIRFLISKGIGQPIREEGNKEHYKKAGTPTMGGVCFTILFLLLSVIFVNKTWKLWMVLGGSLFFGLIGFLDDYEKISKKENEGLTPRQKLILQFLLAFVLSIAFVFFDQEAFLQDLPFLKGQLNLLYVWIPIWAFILVGTVNAVNLTDGLDGLAAGVSVPVFLSIGIFSMIQDMEIAKSALIFAGLLLGYLFYNSHPASVMMGDTGSMAIGGAVGMMLLLSKKVLFIPIFGAIYFIEALSVIIQVAYFKKTGGKRIFLMSPIHHHFELKGYKEQKVCASFILVSLIFCMVGLLLI